jgi:hypothetical protein
MFPQLQSAQQARVADEITAFTSSTARKEAQVEIDAVASTERVA